MRIRILLLALALAVPVAGAQEALPRSALPRGAERVLAVVAVRRGIGVIVRAEGDARLKPGQLLPVGRPLTRRVVGAGKDQVTQWLEWEQVGTVKLRRHLGAGYWIADVDEEKQVTAPDGNPAPYIRTGDCVYRRAVPSKPPPPMNAAPAEAD
jgi:hypothetical protein